MRLRNILLLIASSQAFGGNDETQNSTFANPMLPGWHSDPSCTFVSELDNTTFCVVSTFLNFPGLSIYTTRDLVHFRHVSNAFSRPEQIPGHASMNNNNRGGIWAPTIRYHNGKMHVIVTYVTYNPEETVQNLLFQADDPYSDEGWGIPLTITNPTGGNHIDPDLFWDDDDTAYMATGWGTIFLSTVNTTSGVASERVEIWKGTGGSNPEAPHIYRKDGYYYLLVAEGGAGVNHSATIARATDIWGPYESYNGNPVLTNRGTARLYQTVGHADIFPDEKGNWWATALATRSGPHMTHYPMGREAILTPVTWGEGQWPVFDPVFGLMEGPLPKGDINPPGEGPLVDAADSFNFERNSTIPKHLVHLRAKSPGAYHISSIGRVGSLRLTPSRSNLTGSESIENNIENAVTFVGRRQTATLFNFSVDLVSFNPARDEEAGITVFLNQQQHIDLSIIRRANSTKPQLQLTATSDGRTSAPTFETVVKDIPKLWSLCPSIRMTVNAEDPDSFTFIASSTCGLGKVNLGSVSSDIVSGGFLGTL